MAIRVERDRDSDAAGKAARAAPDHEGGQWLGVHLEEVGPVGLLERCGVGLLQARETHG